MKKSILMLSALSLLIVASCKKTPTKDEEGKITCQMLTESSGGNQTNYTYDEKGRIIEVGNDETYSYSNNQIIVESPLKNSYSHKLVYQLDASGKIISANMRYTYNGNDEISTLKYLYNSDGYLSEVQDTYESETDIDKYNYTNGNLTSIVRTDPNPNGGVSTRITTISYTNDLAPSSFFTYYSRDILNAEILKGYFGKASKNLISEITDTRITGYKYTYQKNAEGNVTQMTEIQDGSSSNTTTYTYNCK